MTATRPFFCWRSPILKNGRFDGIVYGGVNAEFLNDIVKGLTVGEEGQAYILDAKGNVIGHPNSSYVMDGVNFIKQAETDPSPGAGGGSPPVNDRRRDRCVLVPF